jgi:conjugative transfer region protein (TIGR03750 family)
MSEQQHVRADGTVTFLPHRLNRHPVVVRGLTADELWICCGLSGAAGLLVGAPLSWMFRTIALAPTFVVLGVALGVFIGGGILRRLKRGRPDTWLYRQLQWRIATRHPLMAGWVGGHVLISRSGFWTTRRSASGARDEPLQERDRSPAGAHQDASPGCRRAGHRRPRHGRRLVERAARSDHPRPARPALRQHPEMVGGAARIGLCVHVLRVPDPQPLADEWRGGLCPQPPHALAVPHAVLPGIPARGLRLPPQHGRAAPARARHLRNPRPRLRRRPYGARACGLRSRLGGDAGHQRPTSTTAPSRSSAPWCATR